MSYSKPMRVKFKRLLTIWIISSIVTSVITAVITTLITKDEDAIFYTPKVQEIEPTIIPKPIESPIENLIGEESAMTKLGEYTITAYCPCETCCGIWAKNRPGGIVVGAYGVELEEGVSIAAPLPSNTRLYIDGVGEYTVQDKLADWVLEKYDNKVVDIYFNNHEDAKAFGLQHKEVFIVKGDMEND